MLELLRQYRLYILMAALNLTVLVGVMYLLRREEPRTIQVTTPPPRATASPQFIEVQVSGAVNQPGVVKLELGARVADALEGAGGARAEADLSGLNLARKLNDGEEIVVPERAAVLESPALSITNAPRASPLATKSASAAPAKALTTANIKIDINTASLEELQKLPHVGPTLAQRIVDYRSQHGPFKKIEDIKNVKGIGDALFNDLKDLITVE